MCPGQPHPTTHPVYPVNQESGSGSHPGSAAHLTGPERPAERGHVSTSLACPVGLRCRAIHGFPRLFSQFSFFIWLFDASDIYLFKIKKKNHCLYFGLVLLLHAGLWLRQAGAAHLLRSTGTSVLGLGSCVLGSLSRGRGNLAGPGMEPPRWQADP